MPTNNQLANRQLNVDQFLTEITLGIAPDQPLIGDALMPPLPGDLPHAKIAKFDNSAFVAVDDAVGDRGAVKRIDLSKDTVTIDIEGHALAAEVGVREQLAAQTAGAPYDLMAEEMYNVKQAMLLRREVLQAALIEDSGLYGSNVTDLSAGGHIKFNASGDPLPQLIEIVRRSLPKSCGRKPNVFAASADVFLELIRNVKVSPRLYGTNAPNPFPTEIQIAQILGVERVIVGSAVTRNAAGTATDVWSAFAGFFFVPPTAGRRIPAFGYTLEQRVFNGATELVTKDFDNTRGPAGVWVSKRGAYYTPAMLFPAAGWILTNPI